MPEDVPITTSPETTGSDASLDMAADALQPTRRGDLDRVAALQYRHPDYLEFVGRWEKYIDVYESRQMYRFIHRHPREHKTMYEARVARGYFTNYTAAIVDLFVSYVYSSPVTRKVEGLEDWCCAVHADADLRNTCYNEFVQDVAVLSQVYGHVGVLVDAPAIPDGGFPDLQVERESGHRPYLRIFPATHVLDWELDAYGKFEWVKLLIDEPQGRTWGHAVDDTAEYYLIWTKGGWEKWRVVNKEAALLDAGENPLGEVPLVVVYNERMRSHAWFGASAIRDIADINIAILNWSSFGDEEICERCLNVLAMETDDDNQSIELGHNNVLTFRDCTHPPFYLSPGDTPLKLIGDWIDRGKDDIYCLAKLGGTTGLREVREATSGIAYAFEFNETEQSLRKKARALEQGENEIHRLLAKWVGEDWEGSIEYPQEFGVEDFLLELSVLMEGRTNLTSQTAIKELEKRVAGKLFAKLPQKIKEQIMVEIEESNEKAPRVYSFGSIPEELIYKVSGHKVPAVPAKGGPGGDPPADPEVGDGEKP